MTTGDVVYSLRFSLIKILPEPGFDLGSTAGESCVLTARLHMLNQRRNMSAPTTNVVVAEMREPGLLAIQVLVRYKANMDYYQRYLTKKIKM